MAQDIIYLDLNLNSTSDIHPTPMQRTVVRTTSILENTGDYSMAVARFSCPTFSIPMWIPTLLLGQTPDPATGYPLNTEYAITLSYVKDGVTIDSEMTYLKVIQFSTKIPPPPMPGGILTGQPDNLFNAVYDMDTIVRMNNNAFLTAFNDLKTKVGADLDNAIAPTMIYDPATELLRIECYPYSLYQTYPTGEKSEETGNGIQIWYNAAYYSYLPGWTMRVYNDSTKRTAATAGKDILLISGGMPNTWSYYPAYESPQAYERTPDPTHPAILYFNQAWPGFYVFRSLQRIQIIGTGINSYPEGVDMPISEISRGSNNLTSTVICDFLPDISTAGAFQQPLIYTPPSIIPGARFISLMNNTVLNSFTLSVEWMDSLGKSHPMSLFSTAQSANIKFVFVKNSYLRSEAKKLK